MRKTHRLRTHQACHRGEPGSRCRRPPARDGGPLAGKSAIMARIVTSGGDGNINCHRHIDSSIAEPKVRMWSPPPSLSSTRYAATQCLAAEDPLVEVVRGL